MRDDYRRNAVLNLEVGRVIEFKGVEYEVKQIIQDPLQGTLFECENPDEPGKPKYFTRKEMFNNKSIYID